LNGENGGCGSGFNDELLFFVGGFVYRSVCKTEIYSHVRKFQSQVLTISIKSNKQAVIFNSWSWTTEDL